MPGWRSPDPPDAEEYPNWHLEQFGDDLFGRVTEQWYQDVTDLGCISLQRSEFWELLLLNLERWQEDFRVENQGYPLLAAKMPDKIERKPLESVVDKSYRWNVFENTDWPNPPTSLRRPSTASGQEDSDRFDKARWFGPANWLSDFPDIFRVRLVATYFDGVKFLAEKVEELATRSTSRDPQVEMKASLAGYHGAHVGVFYNMTLRQYEHRDSVPVQVRLEVQVITSIQNMIIDMLHEVYSDWRSKGRPDQWEWDHNSPAFSVNYLGNALHYLEGMIVRARDRSRRN